METVVESGFMSVESVTKIEGVTVSTVRVKLSVPSIRASSLILTSAHPPVSPGWSSIELRVKSKFSVATENHRRIL